MTLISVDATNRAGATLTLPLDDISGGFVVESIDGLGPVKATLVSSGFAQLDGAHYQSSRRETRNIKMRLALEPDYGATSVRELRNQLYSFFMPKTEVTLGFRHADGLVVHILGRIETNEPAIMTKEPAVDISIVCFDPDFVDPVPVVKDYATTSSTVDPAGKLQFHYDGTVETGVLLTLLVSRSLTQFTVYHTPPDGTLRTMDFSHALVANDIFRVNTIVGEKSVVRSRGGVDSSVLYALSPQATWLELQPGDNAIRIYAEGAAIPYNIRYTNKYGGL